MDRQSFEREALSLADAMYRVSSTLLRRDADRKDAMQNCLLKAWLQLGKLRDASRFRPWLMRILINECHTLLRQNRRLVLCETPQPEVPAYAPDISLKEAVLALPEKYRLPLSLYYMEDLPIREVSRILRIPAGTVKSRLSRGRDMLSTLLNEEARP